MSGSGKKTTEPGYKNRHGQVVVRKTNHPGTDHNQYVYVLRCTEPGCGHEYGANGSDVHLRLCPACQGGAPGLPFSMASKPASQRSLHEVIVSLLEEAGESGLTFGEITRGIGDRGLYRMRDGRPVQRTQVHARVRNYGDMFNVDRTTKPQRVRLRSRNARSGDAEPAVVPRVRVRPAQARDSSSPVARQPSRFQQLPDSDLLAAFHELMTELKSRGLIRSFNNPVGDLGEGAACAIMRLRRRGPSAKGHDAVDDSGTRYQIKTRWKGARGWRNLMGFRDLNERLFDRCVVVLLGKGYGVEALFHFPFDLLMKRKKATTRGFDRLTLTSELLRQASIIWVRGSPASVLGS